MFNFALSYSVVGRPRRTQTHSKKGNYKAATPVAAFLL